MGVVTYTKTLYVCKFAYIYNFISMLFFVVVLKSVCPQNMEAISLNSLHQDIITIKGKFSTQEF